MTRSIPACAGEPLSGRGGSIRGGVYPRVCGGTDEIDRCGPYQQGLSPRVRGNLFCCAFERPTTRSIPACAGEPRPAR